MGGRSYLGFFFSNVFFLISPQPITMSPCFYSFILLSSSSVMAGKTLKILSKKDIFLCVRVLAYLSTTLIGI